MTVKKQIIVQGSGGLNEKDPMLELYILAQSGKKHPRVCFMPTAAMDNPGYCRYAEALFESYGSKATSLSLWDPPTNDLKSFVMEQDIIFGCGGNSKAALSMWKGYGLDVIFKEAYDNGVIMSGGSAGCVVWFQECLSDYVSGELNYLRGLGFLPYSCAPHYLSKHRRQSYKEAVSNEILIGGYGVDDNAALHFIDEQPFRTVSLLEHAKSWEVRMEGDKLIHKRMPSFWLENIDYQDEFIFNTETFRDARKEETAIEQENWLAFVE